MQADFFRFGHFSSCMENTVNQVIVRCVTSNVIPSEVERKRNEIEEPERNAFDQTTCNLSRRSLHYAAAFASASVGMTVLVDGIAPQGEVLRLALLHSCATCVFPCFFD